MTWRGSEHTHLGEGQFEENGPWIPLDKFSDYMYLQRLFDIRKSKHQHQGKREALYALTNYVEGFK